VRDNLGAATDAERSLVRFRPDVACCLMHFATATTVAPKFMALGEARGESQSFSRFA
jgi:hypothetical protein